MSYMYTLCIALCLLMTQKSYDYISSPKQNKLLQSAVNPLSTNVCTWPITQPHAQKKWPIVFIVQELLVQTIASQSQLLKARDQCFSSADETGVVLTKLSVSMFTYFLYELSCILVTQYTCSWKENVEVYVQLCSRVDLTWFQIVQPEL